MKVVVAGYGIEGKASYDYYISQGHEVTIADEREWIQGQKMGAKTILGPEAFTLLADFDLIIRSPSINPKKLPYGEKVWSATNEFFAKCPALIIGVTGTKGKGTTCSLITSILSAGGKKAHLVGNIGAAALDELPNIQPEDVVVYELSSFQLWDVQKSPSVAVILKIEADHLDVHNDLDDYIEAKANIRRYQSTENVCIYHPSNELSAQLAATGGEGQDRSAWLAGAKKYASSTSGSVHEEQGNFVVDGTVVSSTAALQIPGAHNIENACAAIMAARIFVTDNVAIEQGLRAFVGLPHRLKFVAEKNSVRYYDDSIATTPGSAMAAINSFSQPKVLILGGRDKGADYDELLELCRNSSTQVIAIGENGDDLYQRCVEYGVQCNCESGDIEAIVKTASNIAVPGSVVILSPAAASFDMFTSYADRGDQFISAVKDL